jgi:hypothetical protein
MKYLDKIPYLSKLSKLEFSLNVQPDIQIMNRLYWRSLEVHALTLAENDLIFSQ